MASAGSERKASQCRRLEGKAAVVTGTARGLGLAIAERLVDEGASVLMVDREDAVEAEAARLQQPCLVVDLLAPDAVPRMFEEAVARLGSVDVLVNNAGFTRSMPFVDLSLEDYETIMAINARVPMLATQAAARLMIERQVRGGSIINISSVSGTLGTGNQVAYGMAKGAVRQLGVSTAIALAKRGIRVNTIAPGTFMTELVKTAATQDVIDKVLRRTPLGRFGEPREVAAAAAFLASDDAAYITGQTLYVDGGRLCLNLTMDEE